MLARRGLRPRLAAPDLPWPPGLAPEVLARLAERLGHYAFRLFLRGAILAGPTFAPAEATRYLTASQARAMAGELAAMGLAEPAGRGRYRFLHPARSFGGALEWWIARALRERLALDVEVGVKSGAPGVGGDLDVVAAGEGKLLYLEIKSSPPKHVSPAEVDAFLRRVAALRPHLALFVVDTALRLSDRVLPAFAGALRRAGREPSPPRRVIRETWALTPHLFLANARQDLVENVCRAVAEGLRALSPPPP
jgi:hypothetical protein